MHEFGAICKESRQNAGLTIEKAVPRIISSDSSLKRYESGETLPSPTMVMNMMRQYNDKRLTLKYCWTSCAIGTAFSFVVDDDVDFHTAVLKLVDAERVTHEDIPDLINVSAESHKDEDVNKVKLCNITKNLLRLQHTIEMIKVTLDTMGIDVGKLTKEYNKEYCFNNCGV